MGGGAQGLAHQWKLLKRCGSLFLSAIQYAVKSMQRQDLFHFTDHRSPAELRLLYILNFLNSYMYFSTAMVLPLIGRFRHNDNLGKTRHKSLSSLLIAALTIISSKTCNTSTFVTLPFVFLV
jgi:hypothetical protein